MAGILELDPQTQGVLQAAFAGLQASGPSRMPVSLGQVIGRGGQAGIATYDAAKKLESDLANDIIKRQLGGVNLAQGMLDLQIQQDIMGGGTGGLGSMLGDPDKLEALGQRLAVLGKPGGAAMIAAAERMRQKAAGREMLGMMRAAPGAPATAVQEDAAGNVTGAQPAKAGRGGIFSTLFDSPYVGAQAKSLQALLDAAPAHADPETFRKEFDRLNTTHTRATEASTARREREEAAERQAKLIASLRPPRQEPQPQIVTTEDGVFQVDRNGNSTQILGVDGKPLKGKKTVADKALPANAAQRLFENQRELKRAQTALDLAEGKDVGSAKGDKASTGWKGFVPEELLQRWDAEGVDTRAAIADLGSLIIHERSGAAVTAAEYPRLKPFIPKATDDAETVKKKLRRFVEIYKQVSDDTMNFYRESGYKVPELSSAGGGGRGAPKEGDKSKSKSGKPIVFRSGKWVYE